MNNDHPPIYYALQSRKFWAAIVGFIAIIYVAWHSGTALDPNTVVNAILGIVAAYMGATAFEDGMANRSAGKTTVETPAANVQVTTSDTPPVIIPPAKPRVDLTGLK